MTEPDQTTESDQPDARFVAGRFSVAGFDAQADQVVALESLCRLAAEVLSGEGLSEGRIDLHLVDTPTMTELNWQHMGVEGPTDVLAFPLDPDPFGSLDDQPPMVGDVVLCPAVAAAQADGHTGTVDAEFALLVVHGVLHLLGHDHREPAETALMQARERRHLSSLGFEHPIPAPSDGAGQ